MFPHFQVTKAELALMSAIMLSVNLVSKALPVLKVDSRTAATVTTAPVF